ncbi:hypothetical protein BJX66DRAFT_308688 [Aspergillus keveii]|uniref:Uncharacterized protein n=1 Tax=Aspergillus keveii TaxID=714993 RepID=A0ABR4FZ05_9EURO
MPSCLASCFKGPESWVRGWSGIDDGSSLSLFSGLRLSDEKDETESVGQYWYQLQHASRHSADDTPRPTPRYENRTICDRHIEKPSDRGEIEILAHIGDGRHHVSDARWHFDVQAVRTSSPNNAAARLHDIPFLDISAKRKKC